MTIISQIPKERLDAFAASATTFHDLRGSLTAVRQICSDRAVIQKEGRTNAVRGADALLAGCVRRACAIAAPSRGEAEEKVDALTRLKVIYHGGDGEAYQLMGAMIDAAIAMETEEWLAAGDH